MLRSQRDVGASGSKDRGSAAVSASLKPHRDEERRPDLGGLPSLEDVALQAAPGERVVHQLGAREPLDERRALRYRQHDRAISRGLADYRLGVLALGSAPRSKSQLPPLDIGP